MQRASAVFGLLIFVLWLVVLAVGLAYVTVWAATRKRPQWRWLNLFAGKGDVAKVGPTRPSPVPPISVPVGDDTQPQKQEGRTAQVIPFDREAAERRRRA